ncbi:hypothetical protein [Anaerobiospirillum sp. NML120449]|uniref:hypothetical protein n=1 Tax=Anaerobiospirillum sp. NML120449 TaxID=2932817 RepID=UPI001FF0E571|nr:hypothetical protein [Anaerobiospirillum sp. NML120449]MCK0526045.1 hypothetical protein [Anaerobiospirillum sp. NML120449]
MPHFTAAGISYTGMLTADVLPYPCSMARPSHEVLSGEALGSVQHPSLFRDIALPWDTEL